MIDNTIDYKINYSKINDNNTFLPIDFKLFCKQLANNIYPLVILSNRSKLCITGYFKFSRGHPLINCFD